jgi:hypothetical protein
VEISRSGIQCSDASSAVFLLALSLPILAQSPQATISGIVTDSTGAVISGVQMTSINPATFQRTSAETNSRGFFVLTRLPIGR